MQTIKTWSLHKTGRGSNISKICKFSESSNNLIFRVSSLSREWLGDPNLSEDRPILTLKLSNCPTSTLVIGQTNWMEFGTRILYPAEWKPWAEYQQLPCFLENPGLNNTHMKEQKNHSPYRTFFTLFLYVAVMFFVFVLISHAHSFHIIKIHNTK